MASKEGHVTLNFSPILLGRMRDYAKRHDMKLNAVLKRAFEALEDLEAGVLTREEAPY